MDGWADGGHCVASRGIVTNCQKVDGEAGRRGTTTAWDGDEHLDISIGNQAETAAHGSPM
jgi:hypothetical protein